MLTWQARQAGSGVTKYYKLFLEHMHTMQRPSHKPSESSQRHLERGDDKERATTYSTLAVATHTAKTGKS